MSEEYFQKSTLPMDAKVRLLHITQSQGYEIILTLMDEICQFAETEHFRIKSTELNDGQIARSHAETRGQRILMERLQAKVNLEVADLQRRQQPELPLEEPQTSDQHVLDPLKK